MISPPGSDYIKAALFWLLEQARMEIGMDEGKQRAEQSLRLCAALYWFWCVRGYFREGRSFLEQALERRKDASPQIQAAALRAAGEEESRPWPVNWLRRVWQYTKSQEIGRVQQRL